jgi:hypothetical protein
MPYTAQFFAEKLNVPVEYFNPFRNVQIDPVVNLEELARVAHSLGEVVGLGLRNLAHCPVELNLMPESTLNWVQFNKKKPYFIATVFSLVLVVFASSFLFSKLADINQNALDDLTGTIKPLQEKAARFQKTMTDTKKSEAEVLQYASWLQDRFYWADVLTELHRVMIVAEGETAEKLHTKTGVWIEKFTSAPYSDEAGGMAAMPPGNAFPTVGARPHRIGAPDVSGAPGAPSPEFTQPAAPASPAPAARGASTNEVSNIVLICRGVDLSNATGMPSANQEILYSVERVLKDSPMFTKEETGLGGDNNPDPTTGTFTFSVKVKLKRPMKL